MKNQVMEQQATVIQKKQIPMVWVFPVLALLFGIYLVVAHELKEGPSVTIEFADSEGIIPDKTEIKAKSVVIGTVTHVELTEDFKRVMVHAKIERQYTALLNSDTDVWVVKPRLGHSGISGLGTILSGAYIELDPGQKQDFKRHFVGLDEPPMDRDPNALKVVLESKDAYSVSLGDPVLYKGFRVGRVIKSSFDNHLKRFQHTLHIEEAFAQLVTTNTRFWNTSGLELKMGTEGISVKMSSLESFLSGGISFETVNQLGEELPIGEGAVFELHESYEAMQLKPYQYAAYYWLFFDSSIRGLKVGAPVEYRGLQIGTVERISLTAHENDMFELFSDENVSIPVLIRIDPGRFPHGDTEDGLRGIQEDIPRRIRAGLRAGLTTGNLLTGAMFVNLDFSDDPDISYEGTEIMGYPLIPTASSGVNEIENKIISILSKIDELPLGSSVEEFGLAFKSFRELSEALEHRVEQLDPILNDEYTSQFAVQLMNALTSFRETLQSWDEQSPLYMQFQDALEEIQMMADEIESVGNQLNSKPNSLIFSGAVRKDPLPKDYDE